MDRRSVAAVVVWLAIGVGAFEPFYLQIHTRNHAAMAAGYTELPYRRIPGLRTLSIAVDRRTPPGARILLVLPHRTWKGGYEYGFRRTEFLLAAKRVLPLIDEESRMLRDNVARAEYIVCWRECGLPPGFEIIWRGTDGVLARRTR